MLILAFGNKARHGKDTAAQAVFDYYSEKIDISKRHGLKATIPEVVYVNFADALYEECRREHGMTIKDAVLLQKVGHQRRQENPRYWVDKALEKVPFGPGLAVIADMRYQNEFKAVKERRGYTVLVRRLNQDGTLYIADDRPADHLSEIELDGDNFDFRIVAKTGETSLVKRQAIALSKYVIGLEE